MKSHTLIETSYLTKNENVYYFVDGKRVSSSYYYFLVHSAIKQDSFVTVIKGDKVQKIKSVRVNIN